MADKYRNASLGQRLLSSESWDSAGREKYEAEVQNLLEQPLMPVLKWSLIIISVVLTGMTILCGWLAVTVTSLPVLMRFCFVEAAVLQLIVIAYCLTVVRRGVFHRRRHPLFLSGLMWCFAVLLSVNFLMLIPQVPDARIAVLFVGISITTLIGTGLQLLRTCIEQSELNTHERLLELALRLSDHSQDAE